MIRYLPRHPMLLVFFILTTLSWADPAHPSVPGDQDAETEQAQARDVADSVSTHTLDAYPYVFYTPETKIAFGGGGTYTWRYAGEDPDLPPNSFMAALTFTQRKQMIIALTPEIFTRNRKWLLNGYLGYYHYPDKFWGIGNDTPDSAEEDFEPRFGEIEAYGQRIITGGLMAGLAGFLMEYQPYEVPPGGLLDSGDVPGAEGGLSSGLGVMATLDTRHPRFSARTGYFLQLKTLMYRAAFGSDFHFNRTTIDLRHFKPLGKTVVLAMQGFAQFSQGDVPFNMMPLLGGKYSMRGYFAGRFRDKELITGQAELRYPLWHRFRGVVFAGAGAVASSLDQFTWGGLKPSAGLGLRYVFDVRENIVLRMDFGFGENGNNGLYIMINEAF